jgi:hypothetical protein
VPTARQTPRQRALALAEALGVEIEFWTGRSRAFGDRYGSWAVEYEVEAPHGFVWATTESHTLVLSADFEQGSPDARASVWWRFLVDDLAGGLSPCPYEHCEWCGDV